MTHDPQVREKAEDLYIVDGLTLDEVSSAVKINRRTIELWSTEDEWVERKRQRSERKKRLREGFERLTETMMKQAETTKHSQDVHAAIGLARLTLLKEKESDDPKSDIDRPKVFLEDLGFVADVLKEIDQEGLKALARNFDEIVRRFKEAHR